ncbi:MULTISPECIES: nucleotide exchange factor GrpE [Clostridium]|uniref:Protein GrpE n=1 Tax=Clostridium cibarium TaxID=2762247 RepID=A0ABR8PNN9_9CLOT|nr:MULTISPECIES: nucleotide exchange factor GrpE [Clostridium]MBD7909797.1 nucleotide exchange factor GrpE [Clostridium cibarium]
MEDIKKEVLEENEEVNQEVDEVTKESNENDETLEVNPEEILTEQEVQNDSKEDKEDELDMLRKNKDEIQKLTNEVETLKDRLLRVTAEYENYRKRTAKEKEGIYTDACADVIKEVLPVIDNLERAVQADGSVEDLKKGIEMTIKGLEGSFEKLGVEEIDASGEFDPNLHQAVMHIEDENFDKNSIAEVFMKGYKRGDKVIRHSVVKVAN